MLNMRKQYDLHSQILLALAETLADSRAKATNDEIQKLFSKCPTVPLEDGSDILSRHEAPGLGTMTRQSHQAIAALVRYTVKADKKRQLEVLPRLIAYMRHLPAFRWDPVILDGLPPSDTITFTLVSGLLEIADNCFEQYEYISGILWQYSETIVKYMSDNDFTITFILPSLAGLSRALQFSPFIYRTDQLLALCQRIQPLIRDDLMESIRASVNKSLKDDEDASYSRHILTCYWEMGIPLSPNGFIHGLLVMFRNTLTRVLIPKKDQGLLNSHKTYLPHAIQNAWSTLLQQPAPTIDQEDIPGLVQSMKRIYELSIEYFEDLQKYAERSIQQGKKWTQDAYMQEIMGTSLHVASLISVCMKQVDDSLVNYITDCLFDVPQDTESWVQIAALDAAVLLAKNFPQLNATMINTICRFLATPSPVFECLVEQQSKKCVSIQQYAIERLAQCVQTQSQTQAALSTIYALLNEITRYTEESDENTTGISSTFIKEKLDENQKRQICGNVLSAIVGVAVYLKDDHIISQAFSMLALRRKSLPASIIASLTMHLVDLALVSSNETFIDITNLLATLSKESLHNASQLLSMSVLKAQESLAVQLVNRPEYYRLYLHNLLALFIESGNTIQRTMIQKKKESDHSLPQKLGGLLPVISKLLKQEDFNPHLDSNEETVALFRNMWFHCVLFGFVTDSVWLREWHTSLLQISRKTPVLVSATTNYLESDLEHNSVLRASGLSEHGLGPLRQKLTSYLPNISYEIKNFSFAQVIFGLSVYHIEIMRGRMGNCSYVLRYFMNDGVNTSALVNCLESIADRVVHTFVKDAARKALDQSLSKQLGAQVSSLLQLCCHKRKKVHLMAVKAVERIVASFAQIFSDSELLTHLLELVQLVWLSCEAEYRDEYSPVFCFTSSRINVTIELGDDYTYRRELCTTLYEHAHKWLSMALVRAPVEVSGLLQDYIAKFDRFSSTCEPIHLGRSLALEIGKLSSKNELSIDYVPQLSSVVVDESSIFMNNFKSRQFYSGEISGIEYSTKTRCQLEQEVSGSHLINQTHSIIETLSALSEDIKNKQTNIAIERLSRVMHRSAALAIALPTVSPIIVRYLAEIPIIMFTPESLDVGTTVWNWMLVERPEIENRLMIEIMNMWTWAMHHRKGVFSPFLNTKHPFVNKMTYTPSDKAARETNQQIAMFLFAPHVTWIKFLSSRFYAMRHRSKHLVNAFVQLLHTTFHNASLMSTHSLSRYARFSLLRLGLKVLQSTRLEALAEYKLRTAVYQAAFDWFSQAPKWHYGARKGLALMEHKLMSEFHTAVSNDSPDLRNSISCFSAKGTGTDTADEHFMFLQDKTLDDVLKHHKSAHSLLLLFIESELTKISVWCNPLNTVGASSPINFSSSAEKSLVTDDAWKEVVRFAWTLSPALAVQMGSRFVQPIVKKELHRLIANNPMDVVDVPEALVLLLGEGLTPSSRLNLSALKYWAPVPAITAVNYFLPAYGNHPLILQYAMRSLEYHPIETVFFYVPQIVQALRYDSIGYVERYILEAAQTSQLFAHQIIWNMKANFFVDADKECLKPDALKPTLEKIIDDMVGSFTGEDRAFFEREFKFFGDVTAISGYLKEYIKFGQNEKKPLQKKRLDEELAKIKVDVGVYLPSNPEGHVIDINRTSGRPLQSHAKAPFMATFLIEKEEENMAEISNAIIQSSNHQAPQQKQTTKIWQGAIFKVGDDCRQDVLALQLIAVFKNIFTSIGLDLYVYPYRVVATAPGRGVIDVIPRSISRDQLGREKVNSLYDYFVAKYGGPESIHFQRARINFVQSVAAYSVISYLLQIKDRHNGNIMLDDDGHIIHIDFGFIFDIAPGGIGFESSPFKLTAEMIQVMGGGSEEQAFKQFSELVIKAYLAVRPYAELIMQLVTLMLQSGLPCFKGETIKRMRTRFQVDKSDRVAADFMLMRIKESFANQRTVLYDYFQKLTNGIPY